MLKRIICSSLLAAVLLCSSCGDTAIQPGLTTEAVTELRSLSAAKSATLSANGAVAAYFFNDHYTAFTGFMASALEKSGFDESKPLGEQFYQDGVSWLTYFTDSMRTYMTHYMVLCESAAVNGISLTDSELAALKAKAERGVKGKYGENLTSDDIFEAIKLEALANKLTTIKKAELMPTESRMLEYAEKNTKSYTYPETATVNVRHVLFSAESYGSAEAALAKANEVKSQLSDVSADTVALLALEYSDDTSTCYLGGAYTNLAKGESTAEFDKWCFDESRTVGELAVIETKHGAHIVYFEGAGLPKWQGDISEIMINKEFDAICELLYKQYPVTFNEETVAMIAR